MGVSQKGLHDWIVQRVSAIVMVFYIIFLVAFFVMHTHDLTFERWHALFASMTMRVCTIVVLLLLLWHAWIGLWTVCTDYIKSSVLRLTLEMVICLLLLACFFWGLQILWSI